MSERTETWRDGLTPEQVALVEKAAEVACEVPTRNTAGGKWAFATDDYREIKCVEALAVLRTACPEKFPPVKVKTRGEAVAEARIGTFGDNVRLYGTPNVVVNGPGALSKTNLRDLLRENYASIIDAERDAARRETFEEVAAKLESSGMLNSTCAASNVRKWAKEGAK